jgi:hypothetical protein
VGDQRNNPWLQRQTGEICLSERFWLGRFMPGQNNDLQTLSDAQNVSQFFGANIMGDHTMNTWKKIALAAAATLALAGTADAGAKKAGATCKRAGGEATMITEDLAKYMANAALKNALAAHSWTPHGPVTTKCDTAGGLPHCVARQKACG